MKILEVISLVNNHTVQMINKNAHNILTTNTLLL